MLQENESIAQVKNNVLFGKDDYLYLFQGGQKQFDYLQAKEIVSQTSIENFVSNIKEREEYCKKEGILYLHTIFPSKPLVKREFLPQGYQDIESLFYNYYEKSLDVEEKTLLYPLEKLREAEKKHSTFLKYDTHNSEYGFLTITNSLLKHLDLEPIKPHEYRLSYYKQAGDLNAMLQAKKASLEPKIFYNFTLNGAKHSNRPALQGSTNHKMVLLNLKARHQKRVLIFGDSFFVEMLDTLQLLFSEIFYIRSSFLHKDIVERFQPDILLSGNAERYLCSVESDNNANDILLALYGDAEYKPEPAYLDALKAQLSYKYYRDIYEEYKENFTKQSLHDFEQKSILLKKVVSLMQENNYAELAEKIEAKKSFILNSLIYNSSFDKADIVREIALSLEKADAIELANEAMKLALLLRPNGPYIKEKCKYYANILSKNRVGKIS